ncbi:MAG: PTS glucose transporter subunit IIA [Clostridia bacterium]|nr:PTS glucose transporter subunit IIA [Clostridia bacterium]
MMKFFQKKRSLTAVCDGRCAELSQMPDEAFASGMLGQGVAVFPEGNRFYAPVGGRIESIAESKHAYTVLSEDGLELLIHIGVDTVELKGEGFTPLVREGQTVRAGDPLADADLNSIADRGFSTATAVLITNHETVEITEYRYGKIAGGKDAMLAYRVIRKG